MSSQRARTRFKESMGKEHWLVEYCRTGRVRMLPRKFKFTRVSIDRLPLTEPTVEGGKRRTQRVHWDERERRLMLIVGARTKTFYLDGIQRVKIGVFGQITLDQARRAVPGIRKERHEGVNHNAEKRKAKEAEKAEMALTLRVAFEEMVDTKVATGKLKKGTAQQYRQLVEKNFASWLEKPLARITGQMVTNRLKEIRKRALGNKRRDARGDVADYAMRVLSATFNYAIRQIGVVKANPVRLTLSEFKLKPNPKVDEVVEDRDLPALFKAIEAVRIKPGEKGNKTGRAIAADLIELMLFTGLRSSEASTLQWEEGGNGIVDLDARTITVTQTKNRHTLKLPLTEHLVRLLECRKANANGSPWVFPSVRGDGPVAYVGHFVGQVRQAAGLKVLKPHTLRHTFATIASTVASYAVYSALLNHKPQDVTHKHYTAATWDARKAAMEAVTDYLLAKKAESQGLKLAEGA